MTDPNIIPVDRTFQYISSVVFAVILYLLSMGILLGIRWVLRKAFPSLALKLPADAPQGDVFLLQLDKRAAFFALLFCAVAILPPLIETGFTHNAKDCAPKGALWYLQTLAFTFCLPAVFLLLGRSAYLSLRHDYPLKLSRTETIFHRASKLFYLTFLYAAFGILMGSMSSSWPCEVSPVMTEFKPSPDSASMFLNQKEVK